MNYKINLEDTIETASSHDWEFPKFEGFLRDLPPFDWGPEGKPPLKPVKHVPGIGLVVEEEEQETGG